MYCLRHVFLSLWLVLNLTAGLAATVYFVRHWQTPPVVVPQAADTPAPAVFHSAPSIDCVQKLAELVSLRVLVSDILTVDQPGWLAGYKGAWIVKGDALCVTDLHRAQIQEIRDPTGEPMVRIELPRPSVRSARLDHSQTRTYDLRAKGWIPLFSVPESVRSEALQRAQQIVERTANQDDYLIQAQRQTEAVLTTFYAAAGFRSQIVWHEANWEGATESASQSATTDDLK